MIFFLVESKVRLVCFSCVSGVWFSRISGAEEVSIRVSPGDNVTLYSDCVLKTGFYVVWFRNCSHKNQPPLLISSMDLKSFSEVYKDLVQDVFLGYTFMWNPSNNTHDLLVKNITESDLGLYYCALLEKTITENAAGKGGVPKAVYRYGNRTTRLSLLDSIVPCTDDSKTTSTPPVSDCSVCWKLLASVCPVCVLLITICVYCIYRYRTTGRVGEEDVVEVCYASLDLPSRGHDHLKKNQKRKAVESSDFSTYSEVKTGRV
ncbi:hypothetical protein AMEX_G27230 [Astyanax mexicanus]|uniref:Ig-like domain-containing protein n=1 Tax=Astyanax mexicanus TaxID=7994 RepID=A0A8T2KKN5_ASTMX|nr:hypothetical protein AMEX_G27230 [Astyanax mexicanus]